MRTAALTLSDCRIVADPATRSALPLRLAADSERKWCSQPIVLLS
jgi:hypothetical protein